MKRKFDMRYSSERAKAAFANRNDGDQDPPPMYRADLLRSKRSYSLTAHEFRNIAATTGLSVNTIRQALDGNAAKIDTLWILARFFEIPWLQLFDVDKKLVFDAKGKPSIAPPPRKLRKGEIEL